MLSSAEYRRLKVGTVVRSSATDMPPGTIVECLKFADSIPTNPNRLGYIYVVEWEDGTKGTYTPARMAEYRWTIVPNLDDLLKAKAEAYGVWRDARDAAAVAERVFNKAFAAVAEARGE